MENKNIVPAGNKNIPDKIQDNEDIFLSNALDQYTFWKAQAVQLGAAGKDATREKEYAESYRILLNRFTIVDLQTIDDQQRK